MKPATQARPPATPTLPQAPTTQLGKISRADRPRYLSRRNVQDSEAETRIIGGSYKVPKFLGNAVIHPYSDFLLHDVGTGDGIPQADKHTPLSVLMQQVCCVAASVSSAV
jgi:hypothetical protein